MMAGQVSPARLCAFAVIRRVFEQGAYADRALHAEAAGLAPRERALATALSYGTVQRRATLDHVIEGLLTRPIADLDPPVLASLRLGMFQLLFLSGTADHAAVNESVELVKRVQRSGAGLVNAVLRRAAVTGREVLGSLEDDVPAHAALAHSVPNWLAEMWWRELGESEARGLLRQINEPAESALRVNALVGAREQILHELPAQAAPVAELPEAVVLNAPFDAHGSDLWQAGSIMPQSRGSMLVGHVLGPQRHERVLDLCAAPGAKTTHLAALMGGEGEIVAVERHPGRADALRRTCERMGARSVGVLTADALALKPSDHGIFDRVLLDPPCSGLGTLQSRPDLRWRAAPQRIRDLAALQAQLLDAAAALTAVGGTLAYSVCTISRSEGQQVIDAFLSAHPDFSADDLAAQFPSWSRLPGTPHLQLLPHRDLTDGFFIARLRRA